VNQSKQKSDHDVHARMQNFKEGDDVHIHSFDGKNKWCPGVVATKQGPFLYRITLNDDRVMRRHIDHI